MRRLAESDGVTLDEEIARLLRAERQRRIGTALSTVEPTDGDKTWLEVGIATIADDCRR